MKKNEVGNFLLGRDVFEIKNLSPAKIHNTVFTEYILNRCITVANTAELFTSDISEHDIKETVNKCLSFCAPGPHALVLVVNPKDFGPEKSQRMVDIVKSFSERAFQHSIVFIYGHHTADQETTKGIVELCEGRTYQYKKQDQAGALRVIEDMISKKGWSFLTCDEAITTEIPGPSKPEEQDRDACKITTLLNSIVGESP